MSYIENPKTTGSGMLSAIPQTGRCPYNCTDCFFQGGDSYLEPLEDNLPNLPQEVRTDQVIRVNDGNDSNYDHGTVIRLTQQYTHKFYNTSTPSLDFPAPVVLTLNPGEMTNTDFHRLRQVPANLMFVRFRTNLWNLNLLKDAVRFYCPLEERPRKVSVVLTWMVYPKAASVPDKFRHYYDRSIHVTNSYWQVCQESWKSTMEDFAGNPYVYSCGTPYSHLCSRCGNCLREWHATMERLAKEPGP